jgi:hypothetical protein
MPVTLSNGAGDHEEGPRRDDGGLAFSVVMPV